MIYADQLLRFLEEEYQEYYSVEEHSADFLRIAINKENLKVEITFDVIKQTIELNTFTGKTAVFNSLEVLETNLAAYFFFELQFKPQSKLILDKVMKEYRPNEEYKVRGIEGNATSALKLLTSTDISIVYSDNVYKAQDAENTLGVYRIDASGNIISVPTLSGYVNKIYSLYATSDTVSIIRLDDKTFQFNYSSGFSIEVEIIIEDNYQYNVVAIKDDYEGPTGVLTLDNVFDLESLANLYKKVKSPNLKVENITEAYDMKAVEINVQAEDKKLSSLDVEPDKVADANLEKPEVIRLVRILSKEGKLLYIRYVCTDAMYDVEATGNTLDIIEEEQQFIHKGVLVTPSELSNRRAAQKVSDKAFINMLVNSFYS